MSLHRVRLELIRSPDVPEGNGKCGYELILPLNPGGFLALATWRKRPTECRVRRFRDGREDATGLLIHTRRGNWALSHAPADSEGEPIWRLETHSFVEGSAVAVTEQDGVTRPFRVFRVRPLLRLFGRAEADGAADHGRG